jgi:adenine-specific DNA-methyltransferase
MHTLGARHAACAWGCYAWPDAGDRGFMRSFTSIHGSATERRRAQLEQYAWRNRQAMTESETVLWEALRKRKLGVQFRRQVPLCGRYIADFYAAAARLVVEVDGGSHRGREKADAGRDRALARAGVRGVRVSAPLVTRDVGAALKLVAEAVAVARPSL